MLCCSFLAPNNQGRMIIPYISNRKQPGSQLTKFRSSFPTRDRSLPPGCAHLAPSARGGSRTSHARLRPDEDGFYASKTSEKTHRFPLNHSFFFLCWGFAWLSLIIFSQRLKSPSLRKMISEDLVMLTHPNAAWAAFACDFCRALVRRQVCRWIKMKRNNFAFQVSNPTGFCDLWCCYLWNAYATWSHWFISRFDARLDVLYKVMNSAIPPTPVMMMHSILLFVGFSQAKFLVTLELSYFWCYLIYCGDI